VARDTLSSAFAPGGDGPAGPGAVSDSAASPASDAFWSDVSGQFRPALLSRWMGWRLRLLVGAALLGCLGLFVLARWMAETPHLDVAWKAGIGGRLEIAASSLTELQADVGRSVTAIRGGAVDVAPLDTLALNRSSRWLTDDRDRERHRALQEQLGQVLAHPPVTLVVDGVGPVVVPARPLGFSGLPVLFWLLGGFALVLYLVAMVVVLARPSAKNALYAAIALCQAGNLVFIAIEATVDLGLPAPYPRLAAGLRIALDLATAAAVVNAICLYPLRLPGSGWIALGAWAAAAAIALGADAGALPMAWWWAQGGVAALALVAIALMSWSYQLEPHPFSIVLRRFGLVTISTWLLLTGALASVPDLPGPQHQIAAIGSTIWYLFFASLLLLIPFLSKSQQIMREFALLAAISTVATSLDLLFVAVFSLGQFASLTLSLFVSLAVYSGARQWILNQLLGTSMVTTERMFEQLYRIAREVEAHPGRVPTLLAQLLRELFEPLEVGIVDRTTHAARTAGDGSTLLVPVPVLAGSDPPAPQVIALRFAQRGRRLFTSEDARLTDRIVEQLKRAVAFDKAVEQGRNEERARLAQDLHDDIGARLLTLMYKAPSPEMEEYVRHTLQDLKTLTRGLAAPSHRLSHAAAEWKADLTQRLTAAHVQLGWAMTYDQDVLLSVVQWSALTRVLRELVSNAIAHAQATHLDISFALEDDRVEFSVTDNGVGRNPRAWAHGLGLGGVRKRIKQLGGEVEWHEAEPRGITCRVTIRDLSARP
jgi:signal transduction histidine kinase